MSEICEICARKKDDGKGSDDTCEREYLGLGTDDSRCYRLGYERTLARADRYQAEFSACKALLIAAEGRAERQAERADAATARAEEGERWAREELSIAFKDGAVGRLYEMRRADAAEQRASEARALALDDAGRWLNANGFGPLAISMLRALAALPVEPARRQVTEKANASGAAARGSPEEDR